MEEVAVMAGRTELRVHGRLLRIGRIEGDKYEFLDDPEALLHELKRSHVRLDLFTFMQRLPETNVMYRYPMEWDNLAAVPISTFDAWWTGQIDNKTRNMVRRAEKKGVEIREVPFDDVFIEGISSIYNECPIRQGRPFRHFGKSLKAVRNEEGTFRDRSVFIGAFLGDTMIGFAKLVSDSKGMQAGLMNILSLVEHRDKAPINALIAHAVRSCAARGISFLVYSNFAYGKRQRDSLSDFKRNNGFQRFDLPRYYVPLSALGWLAFRLGLHHRWVERIPEPIIVKARKLRNLWHSHRLQATSEAS